MYKLPLNLAVVWLNGTRTQQSVAVSVLFTEILFHVAHGSISFIIGYAAYFDGHFGFIWPAVACQCSNDDSSPEAELPGYGLLRSLTPHPRSHLSDY